jgi:hypothetical protein
MADILIEESEKDEYPPSMKGEELEAEKQRRRDMRERRATYATMNLFASIQRRMAEPDPERTRQLEESDGIPSTGDPLYDEIRHAFDASLEQFDIEYERLHPRLEKETSEQYIRRRLQAREDRMVRFWATTNAIDAYYHPINDTVSPSALRELGRDTLDYEMPRNY